MTEAETISIEAIHAMKRQLRVSALIFHPERGILLCRFARLHFWMLPGGRVKGGEELSTALVRELVEELGDAPVSTTLRWVIENYFEIDGKPMAEVGFYFLADLPPGSATEQHFPGREEGLEFRWWPLAEIARIDLQPSALASLINNGGAARFEHHVWRD